VPLSLVVQSNSEPRSRAGCCFHAEAELSLRIDRSICPGRPLPKKLGLRLDAFPLSPPLAERLESCGIDRDFRKGQKPSDHAPLLAELRD
jgi:hypothetical protein